MLLRRLVFDNKCFVPFTEILNGLRVNVFAEVCYPLVATLDAPVMADLPEEPIVLTLCEHFGPSDPFEVSKTVLVGES